MLKQLARSGRKLSLREPVTKTRALLLTVHGRTMLQSATSKEESLSSVTNVRPCSALSARWKVTIRECHALRPQLLSRMAKIEKNWRGTTKDQKSWASSARERKAHARV